MSAITATESATALDELCVDTVRTLSMDATRVVSMPCMEHFAGQDQAYRDSVLPPGCRARVSVEAAATFGWDRWVGEQGETIGMERFGASAPAGALYKHFGFTSERVAERGRAVVERVNKNRG